MKNVKIIYLIINKNKIMNNFKRAKIFVLETKQPPQIGDICYISVIGWFICTKEHLKGNVITNLIERMIKSGNLKEDC